MKLSGALVSSLILYRFNFVIVGTRSLLSCSVPKHICVIFFPVVFTPRVVPVKYYILVVLSSLLLILRNQ